MRRYSLFCADLEVAASPISPLCEASQQSASVKECEERVCTEERALKQDGNTAMTRRGEEHCRQKRVSEGHAVEGERISKQKMSSAQKLIKWNWVASSEGPLTETRLVGVACLFPYQTG